MNKILSLDLSTKSTGCAILDEKKNLIKYDCFTATSKDVVERIKKITKDLKEFCKDNKNINKIILEEVRPNDFGTGVGNIRTQKVLFWLQGQVVIMLHELFPKVEIEYIYPNEWRAACNIHTGQGIRRSDLKPRDIKFVKDTFDIDVNDDIADAIGIGYGYLNKNKEPEIISWG